MQKVFILIRYVDILLLVIMSFILIIDVCYEKLIIVIIGFGNRENC